VSKDQGVTLSRYFLNRILLPLLVLLSSISGLVVYYYVYALDETAAYYLLEDAMDFDIDPIEIHTPFRHVSDSLASMPTAVQSLLSEPKALNEVQFVQLGTLDTYYLRYPTTVGEVYVVHQFNETDSEDIRATVFTVLLVSFLLFAVWVTRTIQRFNRNVNGFVENIKTQQANYPVEFEELNWAQQKIHAAAQQERDLVQREKAFSAFLSHEIRHPMTLLGHQLAQFDHQDGLPLDVLDLIDELKQTQRQTVTLSNTILSLWGEQQQRASSEHIDLVRLLALWCAKAPFDVDWRCELQRLDCELTTELMSLLLAQISSNFQKYGEGKLMVNLTHEQLLFSNSKRRDNQAHADSFGVGTFIMQAIANKAGWACLSQSTDTHFMVNMLFGHSKA
jgi:signal transduction histidine kinase